LKTEGIMMMDLHVSSNINNQAVYRNWNLPINKKVVLKNQNVSFLGFQSASDISIHKIEFIV